MPAQSDTWWLLRTGEEIWKSGAVRLSDSFSFTVNGGYWPNREWLSEILFYALYQLGGMPLLTAASAVLVVTTWFIVWHLVKSSPTRKLVVVSLAAIPSAMAWSLRPQLFTLVLVACHLLPPRAAVVPMSSVPLSDLGQPPRRGRPRHRIHDRCDGPDRPRDAPHPDRLSRRPWLVCRPHDDDPARMDVMDRDSANARTAASPPGSRMETPGPGRLASASFLADSRWLSRCSVCVGFRNKCAEPPSTLWSEARSMPRRSWVPWPFFHLHSAQPGMFLCSCSLQLLRLHRFSTGAFRRVDLLQNVVSGRRSTSAC